MLVFQGTMATKIVEYPSSKLAFCYGTFAANCKQHKICEQKIEEGRERQRPMSRYGEGSQPSAREFRGVNPRTREQRTANKDKETREKALLEKRPAQNGVRYINYGRGITESSAGTCGYISEQNRFYTDFSEEERQRRVAKLSLASEIAGFLRCSVPLCSLLQV